MISFEALKEKRDAKVKPHLEQYAPVWMVDEVMIPEDEAIQFNVVFQHNLYGWVNRRYKYDGFNNVLYHKGENKVDEDNILDIVETEPYINPIVTNIPNAYGG